jgi:GDP-L-fucose synthase
VLPALVRKFHEAKKNGMPPVLWGSGRPRREFLHVDDCAGACLFLMEHYSGDMSVNVGAGTDIPIAELAQLVAQTVGYEGPIQWDASKPDGTPRKLLDCSRLTALGWRPEISLTQGLTGTYAWYRQQSVAPLATNPAMSPSPSPLPRRGRGLG